jgi:hypothetical protein
LYDATAEGIETQGEVESTAQREIHWKAAMGAAVTFAVPVGVLCSPAVPVLSAGCCLWVLGGAVAAVGLYQRRSATRTLPRQLGVRLGGIIGMMVAVVASAFNAGALVFERYLLHGGDAMEKAYQATMAEASAASAQFMTQIFSISPVESRDNLHFLLSPDGRAASALLTAAMMSVGITVFSMIGGALGTRIFAGRAPEVRNS